MIKCSNFRQLMDAITAAGYTVKEGTIEEGNLVTINNQPPMSVYEAVRYAFAQLQSLGVKGAGPGV